MANPNRSRCPRWFYVFLIFAGAGWFLTAMSETTLQAKEKEVEEEVVSVRPGEAGVFDYQLYVPKGLKDQKAKRPLIVYLHGGREMGKDVDDLPLRDMKSYVGKALSAKTFPFVVVAPATSAPWKPEKVVAFIDKLIQRDGGRLTGSI